MDINLAGYKFKSNKASLICVHVIDGQPINDFFHESDGFLQFSCGAENHKESDWKMVGLKHIVDMHPYIYSLPTVSFGELAERENMHSPWTVIPYEND
jgi:hypothetical protein